MKKQIAMVTVAIMLMAVLIAPPPVMASAGDKTIDVGGNQLEVVEVTENNIKDIFEGRSIHIRHHISGQLDPNEAHGYGYYLSEGVRVRISINHTPADATGIILGIWDEDFTNGVYTEDDDQDGHAYFPSGSGTYTISESGYYWIVVGAQEDGFSYNGWIDFYIG